MSVSAANPRRAKQGGPRRPAARPPCLPDRQAQDPAFAELKRRGGGCGQEHLVGREELVATLHDELRLELRGAQDIHADDAHGALGSGDAGVELEHRARHRDARQPGNAHVQRFRKAGAPAAHLEVRLPRHRAHRGGDVAHRRAVHEVHAVAERHAERDAGGGKQQPAGRPARGEEPEQAEHRRLLYCPHAAASSLDGVLLVATAAHSQEVPSWFTASLLHLPDDVAEAAREGKRVMLYFGQDGCPYCKRLIEVNWREPRIADKMRRRFVSLAINIWGDREVTWTDGRTMTEKQLARC